MAPIRKVVPGSLTDAYKLRQGDFSPSLVGNQFTDPNAFFTLGNFDITSNFEGRVAKDFTLGEWSEYYNLKNLNITEDELDETISNNLFITLNFNKEIVERYAYFGSFSKALESEIQDIIVKWPASIFISSNPIQPTRGRPSNLNTILDFDYNVSLNTTFFKTPIDGITNTFNLKIANNILGVVTLANDFPSYELFNEKKESYNIEGITGQTNKSNYIYFKISGNPFKSLTGTTFGKESFHIRPKKLIRDKFFNNLSDLQNLLLNKLTVPIYTFNVEVPIKYEDGDIGFSKKRFTWPISDGYNIDINTIAYSNYIENVFRVSELYDENITDLAQRRLVSDSIIEYDTDGDGTNQTGRKVSKLIRIYGAEFDVVKKYINGISFANVITYNKKDNTSDDLIKIMAKNLGFDVLFSTSDGFNLLENNDPSDDPVFSGYSRSLSAKEIDIELWRRLVINAWWLFRSKGTRKVLEFFMKLFGINNCLVTMDEIVYLAKDRLNLLDLRQNFNRLFGPDYFDLNFNTLPVDNFGFPKVPRDTEDFWFQNDGFWYNGGNERVTGNNPHYGPYDYGQRYWDKFRCFVDDFQNEIVLERVELLETNYFTDYNNGTLTPNNNGAAFAPYGLTVSDFFIRPDDNINVLSAGLVEYGTSEGPKNVRDTGDTFSLKVTFQAGESSLCLGCPPETVFGQDGIIYIENNRQLTPHNIKECCDFYWMPTQNTTTTEVCPEYKQITLQDGSVAITEEEVIPALFIIWSETQDIPNDTPLSEQCCWNLTQNNEFLSEYELQLMDSGGLSWNSNDGCYFGDAQPVQNPNTATISGAENVKPSDTQGTIGPIKNPPTNTNDSYFCWWCPPEDSLTLICNSLQYYEQLGINDSNVISFASRYNYNGNDPVQAQQFLLNIYDTYFQDNKCVYMLGNQMLKNKDCCEIRGGTWNSDLKICEIIQDINTCPPQEYVDDHYLGLALFFDPNSTLEFPNNYVSLSQQCCEQYGYYWGGSVTLYNSDNTTSLMPLSYEVSRFLSVEGLTETCFTCPREIKETTILTPGDVEETGGGGIPNTTIYLTDLEDNPISPECCERYIQSNKEINWNSIELSVNGETIKACVTCDSRFVSENINKNIVTNLQGGDISEDCCILLGYNYLSEDIELVGQNTVIRKGCKICPPTIDNYTISTTATSSIFGGSSTTIVLDENGDQLSRECCGYYNTIAGNTEVSYGYDLNTGRCLAKPTVKQG